MNTAMAKTEYLYLQGYNMWVKQKLAKMHELIDKYKERNSSLSIKDKKINKLELYIHSLKNQLFYSDQQKEKKIEEIMKIKEREHMLISENNFLIKQVKDSKKQNRLLKIAISKLQSDFDRVAKDSKQPIGISYSLKEDANDNILQRIERVIEDSKDNELNNKEIFQKLDKANDKINQIAKVKLRTRDDYKTDEGLRKKLAEDKMRGNRSFNENKNSKIVNGKVLLSNSKYELIKRSLMYSPMKHQSKNTRTREVPVGTAQKILSVKKRLGGDDKWKKF